MAASRSDGWSSKAIIDKTLPNALKVRDGLIAFEQDGVVRKTIVYSPTILAFLHLVHARSNHIINLIDFGGGLGTNYFQNRKILKRLPNTKIRWNVVEQDTFADLGMTHFANTELTFNKTLEDLLSGPPSHFGGLLFSGSLQCVPTPFSLLEEAIEAGINIIAMDRLLLSPTRQHAVYIQHPDPNIYYSASYPVWCFAKDVFIAWFGYRGFKLVEHFTSDPDKAFDHAGLIFVRESNARDEIGS